MQVHTLAGKKIVLTGTMQHAERDALEDLARAALAKVQSGVGKSTDYLVVGERPGASKVKKAQKLNITVLSEQQFLDAIPNSISTVAAYIQAFLKQGYDISYYSNEGDGYLGSFEVDFPSRVKSTESALLRYARSSELVKKAIDTEEARKAGKGFKLLDPKNPARGWLRKESMFSLGQRISIRKWNKRKDDWEKIPAAVMIKVLEHRLAEIAVLSIHNSQEIESVVAVHVFGGRDKITGKLVGFVLQRVWT